MGSTWFNALSLIYAIQLNYHLWISDTVFLKRFPEPKTKLGTDDEEEKEEDDDDYRSQGSAALEEYNAFSNWKIP